MKTIRELTDFGALAVVALLAAGLVASPALAASDEELVTASDYDLIIEALENNDFKAELSEDDEGDPLIKSTDKDNPFSIHFYSCTDGKNCEFIQFTSGWNLKNGVTLAKIEEWNSTKVWGQAYRDDDKDPWLGLSVNLKGGVTFGNFDDTVDWWRVILDQFEKHIEWDKE